MKTTGFVPSLFSHAQCSVPEYRLMFTGTGIRRACILVGSQKTLPIAVTVLNGLAPQIGGAVGLAVIPCVVSHLAQIVMDSVLVSYWLKADAHAAERGKAGSILVKKA